MTALRCVVCSSHLLLAKRPGTPLRILCIAAFDVVHRLRRQVPLSDQTQRTLATLLDYGASANARFDRKLPPSDSGRHASDLAFRQDLQELGLTEMAEEYRLRLEELEADRPRPDGDVNNFYRVQQYRESVIELGLGVLVAFVFEDQKLAAGIAAVRADATLQLLFRIAMLCQILDDYWDAAQDQRLRLPSFFTAAPTHARTLVLKAAAAYCDLRTLSAN